MTGERLYSDEDVESICYEKIAAWMIRRRYDVGNAGCVKELLERIEAQAKERGARGAARA